MIICPPFLRLSTGSGLVGQRNQSVVLHLASEKLSDFPPHLRGHAESRLGWLALLLRHQYRNVSSSVDSSGFSPEMRTVAV